MLFAHGPPRWFATLLGFVALGSSGALFVACRKDAPRADEGDSTRVPEASSAVPGGSMVPSGPGAVDAEGRAARGVAETRRDAGAIDPACEGAALSLLAAAVDPRCAVSDREWAELVRAFDARDAGARDGAPGGKSAKHPGPGHHTASALRNEARRDGDGVIVSIVNRGNAPLVVPLRYHPGHPELAFSLLAELVGGRGVFELAPPRSGVPALGAATSGGRHPLRPSVLVELDAGSSSERVYSARIRLPPGGAAKARLAIDPHITKRLDRSCADAGEASAAEGPGSECLPARLPRGRVVLHVGQLVTGIDAGDPARVEWDVP